MPTRRRFRGGGGVRSAFTLEGNTGAGAGTKTTEQPTGDKHPLPGLATKQGSDKPKAGGGLGMAVLPFGMVALDRWAAKKGKRRTKGKKTRGRKRMRGGGCPCTAGQTGGRRCRRTRRRTRHHRRRTRHYRRRTRHHRRRRR